MNQIIKITCFSLLFIFMGCSSESEESESAKPSNTKKISSNDWNADQKKDALENCITSGNLQEFCECSTLILISLFSYDEFKSFDAEIRSGVQPGPTILSRFIEMGKRIREGCQKK